MEHDLNILMIFGITEKMDNFDSYNVLLVIATLIYYCATYDCFCAPGPYIRQYWEYLTKSSYYYSFLSSMTVNSNAYSQAWSGGA